MFKLYSGCKIVEISRDIGPVGFYQPTPPMRTEYSYEPTGQPLMINSEILFGFELSKHTYTYNEYKGGVYDEKTLTKRYVTVYLNQSETQQLYDDPEKFWEVYINGPETAVDDEKVIIKNEEEYNKRKKV